MSAEIPTRIIIPRPNHPHHTLTDQDTPASDPYNGRSIHDLPHPVPSLASPVPRVTGSQRREDYLASQPQPRRQIIAKHLQDFRDFLEESRKEGGRTDAYFEIGRAANRDFRPLSKGERAKLRKRRRMFKTAEVTVPMWKSLAHRMFGCWKFH